MIFLFLLLAADALPLPLQVGKSVALCSTGTIQCPAGNAICDDTSIVAVESSDAGLVLRGLKPGTTLCSAASGGGAGQRTVWRVTVSRAP